MSSWPTAAREPREKWRPTLGLVVLAMLLIVAALPLIGLSFVRLYENQLVRQAESELIGQTTVLATMIAHEITGDPNRDVLLGPPVPMAEQATIEPTLDLTTDPILDRRPSATEAPTLSPAAAALGTRLAPLLPLIRTVTLAGFRILDRDGVVIAGGDEIGRSLAGVVEVATALQGRFRAVMRVRILKHPPPPLYALSRGTGIRVFVAMPVQVDSRIAGVVYASRTPDNVVRLLYAERGKVSLALLLVLVATGTLAIVFTRAIGRPIASLMSRAAAIGQGAPVDAEPGTRFGTREIAALARSLDSMAMRLREHSDYVATFATHVSHELKTPLTAIQGAAELLQDDMSEPGSTMSAADRQRFLANIVADTVRLTALLQRLRELARAETASPAGHTTLREIVTNLTARFTELEVGIDGAQDQALPLSPEDAGIVFGHLADNAVRHGARTLQMNAVMEGTKLRVRIADDGPGIPIQDRERVFETFYTTRRGEGGTGMGLSIVRALLQGRGGSIQVDPAERGTAFEMTFALVRR